MIGAFAGYFTATVLATSASSTPARSPRSSRIVLMILVAIGGRHPGRRCWSSASPTGRCATRRGWCCSSAPSARRSSCSTRVRGLFGVGHLRLPDRRRPRASRSLLAVILSMRWVDVLVIGSALVMMVGLYLFVHAHPDSAPRSGPSPRTRTTAALMGIDVNRAIVTTFAIGAAMAGAAGVLYACSSARSTSSAASSRASRPSPRPCWAASATSRAPWSAACSWAESSRSARRSSSRASACPSANQLKDVIAFTMLVLVLVFRPPGILGERLTRTRGHEPPSAPRRTDRRRRERSESRRGADRRGGGRRVGLIGARRRALPVPRRASSRSFGERPLIDGVISLGQAALLLTMLGTGYVAALPVAGGARRRSSLAARSPGADRAASPLAAGRSSAARRPARGLPPTPRPSCTTC